MASLEMGPLSTFLEDDEIAAIHGALAEGGWPELVEANDDAALIEGRLDDDLLADFMDQLEANEAGCDVYLPIDFEDVFEAAGYRVGSAHALLLALANMKDDMGIEDDYVEEEEDKEEDDDDGDGGDDDDDDDGDGDGLAFRDDEHDAVDLKDQHMRHLWRVFYRGANAAISRELNLRVQT